MHRTGGSGAHERFTYDFVVDGLSLADALDVRTFDRVGCLDAMDIKWNGHAAKALLLEEPPDIAPDRVMIFLCPECADLGCGAFTTRVTKADGQYVWSDFQYENNYDPEMTQPWLNVGPFRFAANDYKSVLRGVAAPDQSSNARDFA
jgi:hypothetical protein